MKTATYPETVSTRTSPLGLASLSLLLGGTIFVAGLGSASLAAGETRPVRVSMTVDAAEEPRPALRYPLFHDAYDQVPGNAAVAYARAMRLMFQNPAWNEQMKQCAQWLELPLDELPVDEVKGVLQTQAAALLELRKATLHERCDWEIPIRAEGTGAMLPHLSEMRSAARLLTLDIRLSIRQGRFADAIERLRAGFTIARHIGDSTLLIEGLVGVAITQQMLAAVEELIQQPGAPNLYWALTDLPPAYLNLWQATRWERSFIYTHLPILREIDKRPITRTDLLHNLTALQHLGQERPATGMDADDRAALSMAGLAWITYPVASEGLLQRGVAPEQLETWSAAEVLVRYVGGGYIRQRDDLFKWFGLPYPVAREGLARTLVELEQAIVRNPVENILVRMLLPALGRAADRFAELDRQFAMLRCVEAIRLHAARHELELPASLDVIEVVPAPADPMTGLPFNYRIEGRTAVLDGPPVPDEASRRPKTYEITIRR
jgi:hypothetical protein